jgi:hypothetical protein
VARDDTWTARDLPVLDATVALLEQSFMVTVTDIAARTDLDPAVVAAALEALDPLYVDFRKTTTGGDPRYWYVFKVTPEARRAVGQWPTAESLASRLAEELTVAAREETDGERKGLLVYAARLVGETLRDATVRAAGRVLGPAFGGRPVPERGQPVPEPQPVPADTVASLVDLPELPELLRTRAAGAGTTTDPEPYASPRVEVPEPDQLVPLPEPEMSPVERAEVPEPGQLAPLPEPETSPDVRAEVAEPDQLAPLPEPDLSAPDAVTGPQDAADPASGEPDEITAN